MTLRQIDAFLFIAGKRRELDELRLLALHASASQGDPKQLRQRIQKGARDVG